MQYPTTVWKMVGKCTTDNTGTCSIALSNTAASMKEGGMVPSVSIPQGGNLVGVITHGKQAAVVSSAGYAPYSSGTSDGPSYTGKLVADRLLVRPKEQLHLTGMIGRWALCVPFSSLV